MSDAADRVIDVDNPREQDHVIKMDSRGRVTIPSSLRGRYGLDPGSDDEIWVDLSIHQFEVVEADDGSGGDS